MDEETKNRVLMLMSGTGRYDEKWLINHAHCTKGDLEELVREGYIERCEKNDKDFMSDNKYAITEKGKAAVWGKRGGGVL